MTDTRTALGRGIIAGVATAIAVVLLAGVAIATTGIPGSDGVIARRASGEGTETLGVQRSRILDSTPGARMW